MKNSPKVSCIMTTFNSEKFLQESIESILNQTFTDFEFIVSDWGSSDNTVKIIKDYQKKDSRIILLENEKRKWIADCLNDCMRIAKGEYIAIMESDDISYKDRFKFEYDYLKNNCDIVLTSHEVGEKFGELKDIWKYYYKDLLNPWYCLRHPLLIACSMFNRWLYDKVWKFSTYCRDVKFSYDIIFGEINFKISFIDKILYFKRQNEWGASIWLKAFKHHINNRLYAIKKYKLPKYLYLEVYYDYYKFIIINLLIKLAKHLHIYNFLKR